MITSRGCPNRCWFCAAWKNEGNTVRELPITEGYNLLDNNILACSDNHIKRVFEMLLAGKKKFHKPIEFTGGLEAKRLKPWHVDDLRKLKPKQLFFAYDEPADLEPLQVAGEMLLGAGWTRESHTLRCYVLCGWAGDTISKAEDRMREALYAGFMPMAMFFRDPNKTDKKPKDWARWQREWSRPSIIAEKADEMNLCC